MADEKILQESIAEEAVKTDKSDKDSKKKKSGKKGRFGKYVRDLKGEFGKIVWPTMSATARNTAVTLAMCVVLGVFVCVVDAGLGWLVDLLLKL